MSSVGPRIAPPVPPPTTGRRLLRRGRRRLGALRRVRPTIEGWIFLATALAVSLAALNTGNNLLYLVFAAMLSLVAMSGVLSESALRRVRVRRRLDSRVFAGEAARGTWFLENPRRFLPHLAIRVEELAPTHADLGHASGASVAWVPARGRRRAPGEWTFQRRGLHRLRGVRVSTTWPFGIFRKWYEVDSPTDVLVCPAPVQAPLPPPTAERQGGVRRSSRGGGRAEPRELRDWRQGEDRRLIHWRTSARRDRHIVVDREREDVGRVEIVVQTSAGPGRHDRFELELSRATAQVLEASRAGREVVLLLPGRPALEGRGEDGLGEMLRQLALVTLSEGER